MRPHLLTLCVLAGVAACTTGPATTQRTTSTIAPSAATTTESPSVTVAATPSTVVVPDALLTGLQTTPQLEQLGVAAQLALPAHHILSVDFERDGELRPSYVAPQTPSIHHERWTDTAHSGLWSYTAWLTGTAPDTKEAHGAGPTVQLQRMGLTGCASPCVVDLWVWLDTQLAPGQWFSLATLALDPSDQWTRVVTVNVGADGSLQLGHVPTQGAADWLYQTDQPFPMRQWVRVTTYLDARPGGVAVVWQDGVVASVANVDGVEGGDVPQFHFGLYAPPDLLQGRVVNDDLTIWTLAK